MLIEIMTAVTVLVGGSTDDRIHYDQNKADALAEMRNIEMQVQECMREGALIMLREGTRSRSSIVNFTIQSCGSVPTAILRKHHCPDKYIQDYLWELATDELNNVLPAGQ